MTNDDLRDAVEKLEKDFRDFETWRDSFDGTLHKLLEQNREQQGSLVEMEKRLEKLEEESAEIGRISRAIQSGLATLSVLAEMAKK